MKRSITTKFRLIGRHAKWADGVTFSEYVNDDNVRRFTATIRGWRGWFLWEGDGRTTPLPDIIYKAQEIRNRIDAGDESVFDLSNKPALVKTD